MLVFCKIKKIQIQINMDHKTDLQLHVQVDRNLRFDRSIQSYILCLSKQTVVARNDRNLLDLGIIIRELN